MKIIFPCLRTLRLADSNKAGMDKLFYYSRMTKISIIKSSTDLDNKNYSQYLDHYLKRYVLNQIVTLKMKRILILMVHRLVIQMGWKALVTQYVNYVRKDNYTSTLILQ